MTLCCLPPHQPYLQQLERLEVAVTFFYRMDCTISGKQHPDLGGMCQEGDGLPGEPWRWQPALISLGAEWGTIQCSVHMGFQTWFELHDLKFRLCHIQVWFFLSQWEDLITLFHLPSRQSWGREAKSCRFRPGVASQMDSASLWPASPQKLRLPISYQSPSGKFWHFSSCPRVHQKQHN